MIIQEGNQVYDSVELHLQSPDIQVVGEILLSKSILKQPSYKRGTASFYSAAMDVIHIDGNRHYSCSIVGNCTEAESSDI